VNHGDFFGHLPVFFKIKRGWKIPELGTFFCGKIHLNMGDFPANLVEDDTGSHGQPDGTGNFAECVFSIHGIPLA